MQGKKYDHQNLAETIQLSPNNSAKKFDSNKVDISILPKSGVEGIALAFMYGEKKYGRYNYKAAPGLLWTQLISAALRHLFAFLSGEDCDKESGLLHLHHVGANIMMLIEYYTKNIGTDNRDKN